jgi:hypothetical protein
MQPSKPAFLAVGNSIYLFGTTSRSTRFVEQKLAEAGILFADADAPPVHT